MSFEFNLPLQALRESFVLATSRYVDERPATSRERVAVPPKRDSYSLDVSARDLEIWSPCQWRTKADSDLSFEPLLRTRR